MHVDTEQKGVHAWKFTLKISGREREGKARSRQNRVVYCNN